MSDLISRSALIEDVERSDLSRVLKEHLEDLIEEQPPVEAKEVVHGEWVNDWNCSECNCSYMDYADGDSNRDYRYSLPNFCPNCGADMRK